MNSEGKYEYENFPMGLATSSQKVTNFLDTLFGDVKYVYHFNYVDYFLIFSRDRVLSYTIKRFFISRLRRAGF